eukprot:TRINITY_DN1620_c0_g1_i2.p1 TRINITY_DN1620_c0_g1~~TRINITY_DN1620_c0_g1_i2.p1  ORF type:complete len:687 (+),score=81.74 TRINITY_DN1620_c0_g1_i2:527-2587(+)
MRVMALAHRFKLDLLRNYLARVDHPTNVFRSLEEFADGACGEINPSSNSHPCYNLRRYLTHSISQFLQDRGISKDWIQSAVAPLTRVIYDQNEDINGFAGLVSLVSADDTRAARGGNVQMVTRLLNASQAQLHLNSSVSKLVQVPSSQETDEVLEWEVNGRRFDVVVVATPFPISGDLKCVTSREGAKDDMDPTGCGIGPVGDRVSKVVTYVASSGLNRDTFGASSHQATNVFTTPTSDVNGVPFFSIGQKWKQNSTDGAPGKTLFKVFSPKPLTQDNLKFMFEAPKVVFEQSWPGVFSVLPPLNLSSSPKVAGITGMYYLSAIESVTVAMEGSVLSAHNIARMIRIDYGSTSAFHSNSSGTLMSHDVFTSAAGATALALLQSFVVGWLVTYSGFGSLNPSSPAHLLVFFTAHMTSLLLTLVVRAPVNAMSVEWISTEIVAGLLAGLGLSLLRSCSILHALIHYSQFKSSVGPVVSGVLTSVALINFGLGASIREAADVLALASRMYTRDQAWCGLGVASGPIASTSCSVLPPLPLLLPLLIAIVLHVIKYRKNFSIVSRESSRWLSIFVGGSVPIAMMLWESSSTPNSPIITLSAGTVWKGSEESAVRWVVSTLMLIAGTTICSLFTGRKNMISQDLSRASYIFVGTWLICLALFMSSGYSPAFSLAQISVQLLILPAAAPALAV